MQSDAMDIDMKGEEISRKESTPSDLLGFVYNMSYKQTSMVTVSPHKDKYKTARHKVSDYASAVLNSSNGVLLLYVSTFLKASPPNSQFMVKHPFTTDRVAVHILPTWANLASPKRFLVYGFVFDPKSPHLSFDIVEVSDTSSPRPGCLLSNRICSLDTPCMWRPQKVHNGDKLVRLLGENYVFSGMSTYLNGALHWLVEPSGVIAYNLQEDRFKTFLLNIPGDMLHVNEYGLCNCLTNSSTKTIGINATSTTSVCNCRYLGESRDKLVYARVTGDSEFSVWILEDYHAGTWSNRHQVRVNRLTKSLFGGRVLAFSRSDAHLVFLRVDERRIVSYNYMTGEMKEVGVLKKTYKGDDRWDGFVVPLEASMLTPRVTQPAGQPIKVFPLLDPRGATRITNSVNFSKLEKCSCHHFVVTQLAKKVLAKEDDGSNTTEKGLPFRSSVFLCNPTKDDSANDKKDRFSELIRLEASLYGSIGRVLSSNDASQAVSRQLSQKLRLSQEG